MRDILGDFGVTFHRYRFENPGSSNTQSGAAYNPAAIVPGATNPDETVIIGAHFDQTNDGPASAWDSQEGHAQVIRVAKLMADYWRDTGTRPAVTVKFIPWDGEESGTLGSADYADNNIVPGQEAKVRSYWNTDPAPAATPPSGSGTRSTGSTWASSWRTAPKLTVRNPGSGESDTMTIPITVVQGVEDLVGPQLTAPAQDQDGTFPLSWPTAGRTSAPTRSRRARPRPPPHLHRRRAGTRLDGRGP